MRHFTLQLNRLLMSCLLARETEHLATAEVDISPRLEAFWSLGGIEPDKILRNIRIKNKLFYKDVDPEEPIERLKIFFSSLRPV